MKFFKRKILLFISVFIVSGVLLSFYDYVEKDKLRTQLIVQCLKQFHFIDKQLDDNLSEDIFNMYIERLDYSKVFLLKEDIENLSKYKYLIDDQVSANKNNFFDLSAKLISERIKKAESICLELLDSPFSFNEKDSINVDYETYDYAKNNGDLKNRWSKTLKYQILESIYANKSIQDKLIEKKDTSIEIKSFEELEKEAREKILKRNVAWFKRLSQIDKLDRISLFINCIANVYDPHTSYFPPKRKEDFDISISGQLEGIGATLQKSEGYIKVVKIVSGSASWRQGDLKAGDLILKVAQGSEPPVDIVDMRLDNAVNLIRGKKGTEVRLTVKKVDGSIIIIPIIRDVVVIEETFVKSLILSTEKDEKIGYILIPKFYVDYNNKGGRDCSDDVRMEIEKLQKNNISSLIIDVRNNSGGSLQDVVEIVGFFIDEGPVVQIKTRHGAASVLSDNDKGIVYDGPLAIMVNTLSASASEILAAAIQDYNRGIIIGSKTFGKGSVQKMLNLDRFVDFNNKDIVPLGGLKMTIQQFYRVNGESTQINGVIPDIIFPDKYMYLDYGERELENPLPWEKIAKANYNNSNITSEKKYQLLIKRYQNKINEDKNFNLIKKNALKIQKKSEEKKVTLNYDEYEQMKRIAKKDFENYKKIFNDTTILKITNLPEVIELISKDTLKRELNKFWIKKIKKDKTLFEVCNMVCD